MRTELVTGVVVVLLACASSAAAQVPSLPATVDQTAMVGTAFSLTLPAGTGGDGTLSYTASGLPDGLSFTAATRIISGTPTTAGTATVSYTVTDADGDTANDTFDIVVSADLAPSLTATVDQTAMVGTAFSLTLPAGTGGDGTLSYTASGLPDGLSFTAATRIISGTPTTAGTATVSYTVTDADGDTANDTFDIVVSADLAPSLTATVDQTAMVGTAFSLTLPAGTGGDGTLSYTASGLPDGLSFTAATRIISGTPTTAGTATVSYTVTDADGDTANDTFDIVVSADLAPSLTATVDQTAMVGTAFSLTLPAGTGGDGTLSYTASGLPDGLSFTAATRIISGTPTTAGTATVSYTVTDADGDTANDTFDIVVSADLAPSLTATVDQTAMVGTAFSLTLPAGTGGDGTLSYTASGLPDGLSFTAATRIISGTPTTAGTATVSYTVTDADGDTANDTFDIVVSADLAPSLTATVDQTAMVGTAFSLTLPAGTGGDGTLSYTASGLPDGLSFTAATRIISGTPTTAGTATVSYTVTDADGDTANDTFDIVVSADLAPSLTATVDQTAMVGTAFSLTLPAGTGGDGTLSYTASGLPDGLSFTAATRIISGTPTTAGTATVSYTVTDADGDTANDTFDIVVSADLAPSLTATVDQTAMVGTAFSLTLPAGTGGDGTLSYTASGLPDGLSFTAATRIISGTPTTAGTATVSYTVTDADGDTANDTFDIVVSADLAPSLTATVDQTAMVGTAFSLTLPAGTGGDGTLSYTASGLPDGLSFTAATRIISGTPTTAGTATVSYTVTDADGDTANDTFDIVVSADLAPSLTATVDQTAMVGTAFSLTLPAGTGGDGTLSYTASGLPDGLSFTASTRTIEGTPTTAGTVTVTYTVTDADGDTATDSFDIVVSADLAPSLPATVDQTAMVGTAFSLTLPAGTGGNGTLSYTVSALPDGLSFTASTRTIEGTPTTAGTVTVTYTVTDSDGDTSNDSFDMEVQPAEGATPVPALSATAALWLALLLVGVASRRLRALG